MHQQMAVCLEKMLETFLHRVRETQTNIREWVNNPVNFILLVYCNYSYLLSVTEMLRLKLSGRKLLRYTAGTALTLYDTETKHADNNELPPQSTISGL